MVVYNVLGQQVRELVNAFQASGAYAVRWDGRDAFGRRVASGLYVYRLEAGRHVAMKKMLFAKKSVSRPCPARRQGRSERPGEVSAGPFGIPERFPDAHLCGEDLPLTNAL